MYGKIDFISYVILGAAVAVTVMDLLRGRIYNWFTIPFALCGFLVSSFCLGWQGSGQALLGFLAGFLFYGWMFGLRILGGGDVKYLMALGAWGGWRYAEEVAILGILIGGLMSFGILCITGRIFDFLRRIREFLLSIFISELEVQLPKVDKTSKMPFGIPISIAAVWVAFAHPFESLGIQLWP